LHQRVSAHTCIAIMLNSKANAAIYDHTSSAWIDAG
jgi:hypothetical protein